MMVVWHWLAGLTGLWMIAAGVVSILYRRQPADASVHDQIWLGNFVLALWFIAFCTAVLTVAALLPTLRQG